MSKIQKYMLIGFSSVIISILVLAVIFKVAVDSYNVITQFETKYQIKLEIKKRKIPFWAIFRGISFEEVKVYKAIPLEKQSSATPQDSFLMAMAAIDIRLSFFDTIFGDGADLQNAQMIWQNPQFTLNVEADKKTNLESLFLNTSSSWGPKGQEISLKLRQFSVQNLAIRNGDFRIEIAQPFSLEKRLLILREFNGSIERLFYDSAKLKEKNQLKASVQFRLIYDSPKGNFQKNVETIDWQLGLNINARVFDEISQSFFNNMQAQLTLRKGSRTVGLSNIENLRSPFFALASSGISLATLKRELILTKDTTVDLSIHQLTLGVKNKTSFATEEFDLNVLPNSYIDLSSDAHLLHQEILFGANFSGFILEQVAQFFARHIPQYAGQSRQLAREYLKECLRENNQLALETENTANFFQPQVRMILPILISPYGWLASQPLRLREASSPIPGPQ